jgi:hypothetical protein
MERHAEAMFTYDSNRRIRTVNEPWDGTVPAPRFFLGRPVEGAAVCRFRYDVGEPLREELEKLCAAEGPVRDFPREPEHFERYCSLLRESRFSMGPCFLIPPAEAAAQTAARIPAPAILITRENIARFSCEGFEWLAAEIDCVQPCAGIIREDRIVSLCRSVRISPGAHEAGLETALAFRGRGYASAVTAAWAAAVRSRGSLPLYSTSWENKASQRVAQKSSLLFYGANFSIP